METDRLVKVADGTVAEVLGCVRGVLVSYRSMVLHLKFLVVKNAPFNSIGSLTLEEFQTRIDYTHKYVTLVIGEGKVVLPSINEPSTINGDQKNSDEF